MKNIYKLGGGLLLAAMLSACALPHTEIRSGTQRPSLAIIGAPMGSTLLVDGVTMGDASQYDGHRQVLTVEEGLHTVVIELNGTVLRTQKVYAAGGETSKVEVSGENR